MSYCPKCGDVIDGTIVFCPKCGTTLKDAAPIQEASASGEQEKTEKQESPAVVDIQEKNQYDFVKYLASGLIIIVLGVFAILDLTIHNFDTGQAIPIALILIGIIIIIAAIYVTVPTRKYFQRLFSRPKKEPAKT